MDSSIIQSTAKVGVYCDVANMYRNGGQRMQYDVLREFACRDWAEPVRLNAYVTYDAERAKRDFNYRDGAKSFHSKLRDYGYKVIVKEIRWYHDDSGNRFGKADADLDLAVDALLQSEKLNRVLIASGDGDFVNVVRALQNRGCRVEIVSLDNASNALRQEADLFISGFLIPGLIPMSHTPGADRVDRVEWGEIGSRVRGWCYWHEADRGFGYLRFLQEVGPGLWFTDARHPDSPYETAFFHDSNLPPHVRASHLPSRRHVFEFELQPSEKADGLQALDLELVSTG
ncbi:MAG: NYN domain-containing protein [bacterium]|nr:NYN domain-containing protein [bacterium]